MPDPTLGWFTGFRAANWHAATRVNPSRTPGRFHRLGDIVQYLCLHPLGPYAEHLRNHPGPPELLTELRFRMWVVRVPDLDIVTVSFATADQYGIAPADLVADTTGPCQDLAEQVRGSGAQGMRVPSAALPGTDNLVLFGPRVGVGYLTHRIRPSSVPAAVSADDALPHPGLYDQVRFKGMPHPDIDTSGHPQPFQEPVLPIRA